MTRRLNTPLDIYNTGFVYRFTCRWCSCMLNPLSEQDNHVLQKYRGLYRPKSSVFGTYCMPRVVDSHGTQYCSTSYHSNGF